MPYSSRLTVRKPSVSAIRSIVLNRNPTYKASTTPASLTPAREAARCRWRRARAAERHRLEHDERRTNPLLDRRAAPVREHGGRFPPQALRRDRAVGPRSELASVPRGDERSEQLPFADGPLRRTAMTSWMSWLNGPPKNAGRNESVFTTSSVGAPEKSRIIANFDLAPRPLPRATASSRIRRRPGPLARLGAPPRDARGPRRRRPRH